MAVQRYDTLTPTSGLATYPDSVMEERRFLGLFFDPDDKTASVTITDETIAASASSDGYFRLAHVPKGSPLDPVGANRTLDIYSGASKTGTRFTPIPAGQAFGAASAREFRYYVGENKIDVSPAQIANGSFTTLYATYYASHTPVDPELIARLWQEVRAVQNSGTGSSTGTTLSYSAVAAENLTRGFGYIDPITRSIYQVDDMTDLAQIESLVWIDAAASNGATFTAYLSGSFSKPASITELPVSKPLLASRNALVTWDQDPSANKLIAGDWAVVVGRSVNTTTMYLNLIGMVPRRVI